MGAHAKRIVKYLVGQSLIRTGLWNRVLRTRARRQEAIILTYHRVIEKWDRTLDYSQPGMVVTAETFDRQLDFLTDQFDVVPLCWLIADQNIDRSNPRPRCIITFDDGWRDNYEIAFPILRKHRVPAAIFLTTDFIGTSRVFWHTELIYLLLHGQLPQLKGRGSVFRAYPAPVCQRLMRFARMRQIPSIDDVDPFIEAVKATCSEDTIEGLIRDLTDALGLRKPLFPGRRFFLDWDQVCKMAAAGIEIGSHGCSHRILTRLPITEVEAEFRRSKELIEQQTGKRVHFLAFPDNKWNNSICELSEAAGYLAACNGRRTSRGVGRYLAPRFGIHEGMTGSVRGSDIGAALAFEITKWNIDTVLR